MKLMVTFLSLVLTSSAVMASCLKADRLSSQAKILESEAQKMTFTANYLNQKFLELGGEYQNNDSIGSLMADTRSQAIRLQAQSTQVLMKANEELIACLTKSSK